MVDVDESSNSKIMVAMFRNKNKDCARKNLVRIYRHRILKMPARTSFVSLLVLSFSIETGRTDSEVLQSTDVTPESNTYGKILDRTIFL